MSHIFLLIENDQTARKIQNPWLPTSQQVVPFEFIQLAGFKTFIVNKKSAPGKFDHGDIIPQQKKQTTILVFSGLPFLGGFSIVYMTNVRCFTGNSRSCWPAEARQMSKALAPPRRRAAPSMNSDKVICPSPLSSKETGRCRFFGGEKGMWTTGRFFSLSLFFLLRPPIRLVVTPNLPNPS